MTSATAPAGGSAPPTNSTATLSIRNVTKRFGGVAALSELSIEVADGELREAESLRLAVERPQNLGHPGDDLNPAAVRGLPVSRYRRFRSFQGLARSVPCCETHTTPRCGDAARARRHDHHTGRGRRTVSAGRTQCPAWRSGASGSHLTPAGLSSSLVSTGGHHVPDGETPGRSRSASFTHLQLEERGSSFAPMSRHAGHSVCVTERRGRRWGSLRGRHA